MTVSLQALRHSMRKEALSAYIVPTGDPHASEMPATCWEFRKALCPFTGSAGTLLVTDTRALLWTDSRYWEQARRELTGSPFELICEGHPDAPSLAQWLTGNLGNGQKIGIDATGASIAQFEALTLALKDHEMVLVDASAIAETLWTNRPEPPRRPALPFLLAQKRSAEKLRDVRELMHQQGADTLLCSALDDVAWLCNLRGQDHPCTPVFLAHLVVEEKSATLFVDSRKLGPATCATLAAEGIQCQSYAAFGGFIHALAPSARILVDKTRTSAIFLSALDGKRIIEATNPITILKSRKSFEEIASIRKCMVIDGLALVKLFYWLDERLALGASLSEWDVAQKLLALRSEAATFIGPSFGTIAAVGANAAEPHYAPKDKSASKLHLGTVLLLDCGGQYLGATTDITRTVALGNVSEAMRRDFTAVLRGHIALACTRFPKGVHAARLDTLARLPLWEIGADYGHGTGHGVGFFLNVHEGPLSISPRTPANEATRLVQGVVFSNEPGLYRAGKYGIRIENLVTPMASGLADYLEFETLSLCPIDKRLIDRSRLSERELSWLNAYHAKVYQALSPHLDTTHRHWLQSACAPL